MRDGKRGAVDACIIRTHTHTHSACLKMFCVLCKVRLILFSNVQSSYPKRVRLISV